MKVKKQLTTAALVMALAINSISALGHGEEKLGPHGGFIRMPGGFHTEVVASGATQFKVYLLDIHFKNPTIQGSKIEASWSLTDREVTIPCRPAGDHFQCALPKGASLTRGELKLKPTREQAPGSVASYKLPLQLKASSDTRSPAATGHDQHH